VDQDEGVTPERIWEIFEHYGHVPERGEAESRR
jgi:hypothetical protein